MLALAVVVTSTAQGQKSWQSEIGIQGGYTRLVDAGSGGGHIDLLGLPNFNLGPAAPFAPSIYAILPWKQKIGIELGVSAAQLTGSTSASLFEGDIRGNYAVTKRVYVGAGGALGHIHTAGTTETQLGLHGAVGYRSHLTGPLNARLEVRAMFWGKTNNVGPRDLYSVLFGVSTRTRGAAAAPSRSGRASASSRAWTPQLGVAAGYVNMHPIGGGLGGDVTAIAFPGFGGALGGFGSPQYTAPPTIFAIVPIGTKIALEPGVDITRQQSAGTTVFSGNLGARFDYAVHGRWYAALGGNLNYIKSGSQSASRTGLHTAFGYRFPVTSVVGGRLELNYTMWRKNTTLAIAPVNVFGLMFGATVPLK